MSVVSLVQWVQNNGNPSGLMQAARTAIRAVPPTLAVTDAKAGIMAKIDAEAPETVAWLAAWRSAQAAILSRQAFVARFTPAEQVAIAGTPAALVLWLKLLDYQTVDLNSTELKSYMAELVSLNVAGFSQTEADRIMHVG